MCSNEFWKGEELVLNEKSAESILNCLKEFLINKTFEILSIDIGGRVESRITRVIKNISILRGRFGKFILIKMDKGESLTLLFFDKIIFKLISNESLKIVESRVPYEYQFLRTS